MNYEWDRDTRHITIYNSRRVHSGSVPCGIDPSDYIRLIVADWKADEN